MTTPRFPKAAATAASGIGIAVWLYICLVISTPPSSLLLLGLAVVPYAVCLSMTYSATGSPYYGFFGSVGALVGDALIIHPVFVSPTSSTSSLAILAVPMANLIMFIPGAILLGYLLQRFGFRRDVP